MPNFKEYMQGEMANGEPIPSRENPFYFISKSGTTNWRNQDRELELVDTVVSQQGTLNFIVRQGHYVKIEIEHEESGYFKGRNMGIASDDYASYSYDYDGNIQQIPDHRINQFETGIGGNSILQLTMYGGSAIAISSEELDHISSVIETEYRPNIHVGLGGRDDSAWIYLTPSPPQIIAGEIVTDPVAGRSLKFYDFDDTVYVRLLEVGLTVDASGETYESAVNDAVSFGSFNRHGGEEVGSRFETDVVNVERAGNSQDPAGQVFTITVVEDSIDQTWTVHVNGVKWSPSGEGEVYFSREEADTEAARLLEYFQNNELPNVLKKDILDPTPEPEPFQWSWNNPVVKWGTIAIVVAVIGFGIYTFTRTAATESGKRLAGTS